MNAVDTVFHDSAEAFCASDFSLIDIIEYVNSAIGAGQHTLAYAITGHMRDLLAAPTQDILQAGTGDVIEFGRLFLACFRLAVFDPAGAALYGTENMLSVPEADRLALVRSLAATVVAAAGDEATRALAIAVPASRHAH